MRPIHKRQRPDTARHLGDGLKLHLRELAVGRRVYRPLAPEALRQAIFHQCREVAARGR